MKGLFNEDGPSTFTSANTQHTHMKHIFLCLALSAMTFGACAQDGKAVTGSGPAIALDKDDVDYGTIKQGADGNRQFTVKNTGDQPLIISQCQGSCGCTVPKCDTAPIAPGQTSVVNVHYDTNRVGPFTKTVTVTSNATNTPSKVVSIHGTVEAGETAPAAPVKEVAPAPVTPK